VLRSVCVDSRQVNDDTSIVSPNWAPKLISALASNPFIANFGVTGPTDSNNEKIFTHSFVHRTHIEVRVGTLWLGDQTIFIINIFSKNLSYKYARFLAIYFPRILKTGGPTTGLARCTDPNTPSAATMY
jgi:hypothetical protein